jgi:hypothetical protein
MASGALAFWKKWKAPLLALCDNHHESPVVVPQAEEVQA